MHAVSPSHPLYIVEVRPGLVRSIGMTVPNPGVADAEGPSSAVAESIGPDARIHVPDHVVFRAFPNETVVLNLTTGRYHGLNPVGGRMLEALSGGATLGDAARKLAEEHSWVPSEVQEDMREFCTDLLARGLIELADGESDGPRGNG
jgi:coenzyme PQQ synthesis protein D (PqqD)